MSKRQRGLENPIFACFSYDEVQNVSVGKVGECKKSTNGRHVGNLNKHLQRHHKEEHAKFVADKGTLEPTDNEGYSSQPNKKSKLLKELGKILPLLLRQ